MLADHHDLVGIAEFARVVLPGTIQADAPRAPIVPSICGHVFEPVTGPCHREALHVPADEEAELVSLATHEVDKVYDRTLHHGTVNLRDVIGVLPAHVHFLLLQ